jgi:hypothetical protein
VHIITGGKMTKSIITIFMLLILFFNTTFAQPQIFTDFFNGKAHIIDNDIMDDAHTIEIALAAGSSGLINLKAITISRWVPYENRWNAVVQQAWGAMIRTAAIKDGFANVPPIYPGAPLGRTFDQRIPSSHQIEDTAPFKTPAGYKIVAEAIKCTARNPLIVIVGGRATCIADAYLINPAIADKVIVAEYLDHLGSDGHLPGYNIKQDMWAANIVLKNFRVIGAYSNSLWKYAPAVYLDPGNDADRGKMPGKYLEDLMCLKPHPLLKDHHADGDGHAVALLQAGFGLIKSYKRWSYDRYEGGKVYLKPDSNGDIVKVIEYTSPANVTNAWWNVMKASGVFSNDIRTKNITVFDGAGFAGSYKENGPHFRDGINYERAIAEGDYTKDDLWSYYGITDNTISSVKIPGGWKVTLYDGEHFDGKSAVYTSDISDLGKLDNAVSSLKIEYTGN